MAMKMKLGLGLAFWLGLLVVKYGKVFIQSSFWATVNFLAKPIANENESSGRISVRVRVSVRHTLCHFPKPRGFLMKGKLTVFHLELSKQLSLFLLNNDLLWLISERGHVI